MRSGFQLALLGVSLVLSGPSMAAAQAGTKAQASARARQHARHTAAACATRTGEERITCEREFAAMQQRGHVAMGVDQYTSVHVFEELPDGGRIEFQTDVADTAGIAT
ncbi:MAG: hypothetical protein ACREL7_15215 [Longimicrobiales bacterium]